MMFYRRVTDLALITNWNEMFELKKKTKSLQIVNDKIKEAISNDNVRFTMTNTIRKRQLLKKWTNIS